MASADASINEGALKISEETDHQDKESVAKDIPGNDKDANSSNTNENITLAVVDSPRSNCSILKGNEGVCQLIIKQSNQTFCFVVSDSGIQTVGPILLLSNATNGSMLVSTQSNRSLPIMTQSKGENSYISTGASGIDNLESGHNKALESQGLQSNKVEHEQPVKDGKEPATIITKTANSSMPTSTSVPCDDFPKQIKSQDRNKIIAGDSIYVCNVKGCGRIFTSLGYLTYHQEVHKAGSKNKSLVCKYEGCGRKFTWPSHYKYHLLTHNDERVYQCDITGCAKSFLTLQRLKVHYRTHSGSRPYRCDFKGCDKAFTTMGNMRNHQRIHTGERPFQCDHEGCNCAFAEHSSLKKHKLVHTGEKRYTCPFCDKTFSQSGSRNVHVNKQHAGQTPPGETKPQTPESQSNLLVLTHYHDHILPDYNTGEHVVTVSSQDGDEDNLNLSQSMLHTEEELPGEDDTGLGERSNVVVLSEPEELASMAYQSATQEEIVYDNDILNSHLEHDLSQHLDDDSQDKTSADRMMESILNS